MCKKLTLKDCVEFAKSKDGKCLSTEYINTQTKMEWMCKFGHKWLALFCNIKNKNSWCPYCSGKMNNNIELCCEIAKERNGKCLSLKYTNAHEKLEWKCANNHRWFANLHHIKNGEWCPYCAGLVKHTLEDCINFALNKNGKCLSDEYTNNHTKMKWECEKGHIWITTFGSVNDGSWCPFCIGQIKHTIEECKEFAILKGGVCLSEKYVNGHSKLLWECEFKHQWGATFDSLKNAESWCPECAGSKKKDIEYYLNIARKIDPEAKCLSTEYINSGSKLLFECSMGHIFYSMPETIQKGCWCSECAVKKTQKSLKMIIEKILNKQAISNFRGFGWLRDDKKLEIDIYIPDLKLAIEYDGEQHFKPVRFGGISEERAKEMFKDTKERDKLKNKLIKSHIKNSGVDIQNFIRFNYRQDITEELILNEFKKEGLL